MVDFTSIVVKKSKRRSNTKIERGRCRIWYWLKRLHFPKEKHICPNLPFSVLVCLKLSSTSVLALLSYRCDPYRISIFCSCNSVRAVTRTRKTVSFYLLTKVLSLDESAEWTILSFWLFVEEVFYLMGWKALKIALLIAGFYFFLLVILHVIFQI